MSISPVREQYEDGVCPDCGEEIPESVVEGMDCTSCGHVFNAVAADD